jgi:hypothetical protein
MSATQGASGSGMSPNVGPWFTVVSAFESICHSLKLYWNMRLVTARLENDAIARVANSQKAKPVHTMSDKRGWFMMDDGIGSSAWQGRTTNGLYKEIKMAVVYLNSTSSHL